MGGYQGYPGGQDVRKGWRLLGKRETRGGLWKNSDCRGEVAGKACAVTTWRWGSVVEGTMKRHPKLEGTQG